MEHATATFDRALRGVRASPPIAIDREIPTISLCRGWHVARYVASRSTPEQTKASRLEMNEEKKNESGAPPKPSTALTASSGGAHPNQGADLAKHAKDALSHAADQAKGLVGSQLGAQQKRSAGDLTKVAKALRGTSHELGDSMASPIVDRAAQEIERASKFLETATVGDVVDGVETFAKREPLLFLGGAFALGLLGARFLKSSARRNEEFDSRMTPAAGTPVMRSGAQRPVAPPMRTGAGIAREKGEKRFDQTLPFGTPNGSNQGRMP